MVPAYNCWNLYNIHIIIYPVSPYSPDIASNLPFFGYLDSTPATYVITLH